ncbi:hypothetical protein BJ166DRAFT_514494 [Pestalotiopsis sp. NC0098]|nr:hypothetical protein BJ166DRAFT_514494 [Pestalotiopsis sp. NC0098]
MVCLPLFSSPFLSLLYANRTLLLSFCSSHRANAVFLSSPGVRPPAIPLFARSRCSPATIEVGHFPIVHLEIRTLGASPALLAAELFLFLPRAHAATSKSEALLSRLPTHALSEAFGYATVAGRADSLQFDAKAHRLAGCA